MKNLIECAGFFFFNNLIATNLSLGATDYINKLIMNNEIPYIIIYTNHFYFDGIKLAFRKQELFNINSIPIHIPYNTVSSCWYINRKQLSKSKAKELIKMEPVEVDVTPLQWYQQEQLNHVFNL